MGRRRRNHNFNIHVDPSCLDDEQTHQTVGQDSEDQQTDTDQHCEQAMPEVETDTESQVDIEHQAEDQSISVDPEASVLSEYTDDSNADVSELADLQQSMADDSRVDYTEAPESDTSDADEVDDTQSGSGTVRPSIEHDDDEYEVHGRQSTGQASDEYSVMSTNSDEVNEESFADDSELDHNDTRSHISRSSLPKDDGAESSSQHEGTDEDVFSDKSPRSSVGSCDAGSESGKRSAYSDDRSTVTRSPRVSGMSQYERDDFIPTTRTTPRPRFRTTSDVRAMQMSSPSGSVYGGASPRSPRSPKRSHPAVSRLGTPTSSTQYSPKKGSTPPRFKVIKEAPLVLLHVTLVPLHWAWGELVNSLNPGDLSDEMKGLRDSWRILQDRIGDTVVERGILLGHPQNDYELLEERLLEALELPQRKRARILECGHYLGPSNDTTVSESEESEDEYAYPRRESWTNKRHWCSTCKSEIRLEQLGSARVFRVKVYASNGLMRAGAWAACWKEMERVDAEIEPIVSPSVQDELVRLAALQEERVREVSARAEGRTAGEHASESTPPQEHDPANYHPTPGPPHEETAKPQHGESVRSSSPRAPSEEAQEHRDNRRKQLQGASLPRLLLEALKVFIQDRKNLIIIALSVIAAVFAVQSAPQMTPIGHVVREFVDSIPQLHITTAIPAQEIISQAAAPLEATPAVETPVEAAPAVETTSEPHAFGVVLAVKAEIPEVVVEQEQKEWNGIVASKPTSAPVVLDAKLEVPREGKKPAPLELDAEPFTPLPDHGLELVKPKTRKPVVLKETIKVYRTVTETQVEFETHIKTIRIYATETCEHPQPAPTTPKRLEIGS